MRFGDLDANAHLNNVVYLRYFETARIAFVREMVPALDPGTLDRPQRGLIFAECNIRYRSPVHFDEEVTITCRIGEVRRSAFQMCFEMKVDERLVAEGYGWLVGFDYAQQKAARLPDALRAKLDAAA